MSTCFLCTPVSVTCFYPQCLLASFVLYSCIRHMRLSSVSTCFLCTVFLYPLHACILSVNLLFLYCIPVSFSCFYPQCLLASFRFLSPSHAFILSVYLLPLDSSLLLMLLSSVSTCFLCTVLLYPSHAFILSVYLLPLFCIPVSFTCLYPQCLLASFRFLSPSHAFILSLDACLCSVLVFTVSLYLLMPVSVVC